MKKLFLWLLCVTTVFAVDVSNPFITESLTATAQLVKASGGAVYGYKFINTNASPIYVHFYNAKAASNVTVGTTTQLDVVGVPATGAVIVPNTDFPQMQFTNGLVIAATTTATSSGNTAPGSGLQAVVQYQ